MCVQEDFSGVHVVVTILNTHTDTHTRAHTDTFG